MNFDEKKRAFIKKLDRMFKQINDIQEARARNKQADTAPEKALKDAQSPGDFRQDGEGNMGRGLSMGAKREKPQKGG